MAAILVTHAACDQDKPNSGQFPIPMIEVRALLALGLFDGPVHYAEIAQKTGMLSSTVRVALLRLKDRGPG